MTLFRHGLLVGKFYPPHAGHHAAIRAAAQQCEELTVLAMAATVETVPLADRTSWLRAEHRDDPSVRIAGIRCDAPLDITDLRVWTAQLAAMRAALRAAGAPSAVDGVFCGDSYGGELARRFDARCVPIERSALSSTAVRRDLTARWPDLAPATRAGLTTRVVVVGAESSGTTTLTQSLSGHYGAPAVLEYGREYSALKRDLTWNHDDFDVIGAEQTRREQAAAHRGGPVLFCDTDAFATAIWERRYLGSSARTGQPWTQVPPRAVYLLTDHSDVPWEDDGTREGNLEIRAAMTDWFADALTAAGHSWVLITGDRDERLDLAIRTVDPLLALAMRFGEPMHGPGFGVAS
jgi:HTH-type transcriptional repressor of NAD biosynthesis genes